MSSLFQIRVCEDDGGGFAAQFKGDFLEVGVGRGGQNLLASSD